MAQHVDTRMLHRGNPCMHCGSVRLSRAAGSPLFNCRNTTAPAAFLHIVGRLHKACWGARCNRVRAGATVGDTCPRGLVVLAGMHTQVAAASSLRSRSAVCLRGSEQSGDGSCPQLSTGPTRRAQHPKQAASLLLGQMSCKILQRFQQLGKGARGGQMAAHGKPREQTGKLLAAAGGEVCAPQL